MPRESAANYDIVTFRRSIEQIAKLGQKMLKVAIHREHISTVSGCKTFRDCQADSVWRYAVQGFYAMILGGKLIDDVASAICAAVIYRNHLVNVVSIERENPLGQWTDVHLLVVTRNHE